MASFEALENQEPWKAFRPCENGKVNPRAWWRYAILAERHKVRSFQRADMWRLAGDKGMNLLSHARVLIANNGSVINVDLSDLSETFLNDTARKLKTLEIVVDDLNRENMTLRKLIKSLLTPGAKEELNHDPLTLQYIESQIARFEHYAELESSKITESIPQIDSPASPVLVPEASEYTADEDKEMETAISNIESPNLNLRSPYENLLPPIELTDRELREQPQASKRDKLASLRKPQPKPVHDRDKFPSYLEREAMRKEAAIKKRNQNIVKKAEELLQRSAAVDSETAPTMFLPVLANKASPRGALPPRSASSASSADTASAAVVVEERSVADSAVSVPVGSSKRDSSSNRPKPSKPIVHPPWVDDVKVVEPLAGRGKGKAQELKEPKDKDPGEPSEPSRSKMGSKSSSKAQSIGDVTAPTSVLTVPVIAIRERTSPPRDRVVYPVPSTDMTQGEKLTVQLISKARERVMTAEEAKKPLSNTEKALLKSPLAIPLIKPQPGDLSLSPREKALRSSAKVVPVVNSHNSPRDRAAASAVSAGSTVATSGVSPRVPAKGSPRSPQKGVSLNRIMAGDGAQNGGTSKRAGAIQESRSVPEPPTGATSALPAVFSPSSSPAKDPASEKSKKKNVLKALNEKSNPDSPRGTAGGTDAATDTGLSTGWSAGTVLPVGGDRLQLLAQLDEVQRSLAQTFTKASIDAALAHTKSN